MNNEVLLFYYIFICWFLIGLILAYGAYCDHKKMMTERKINNSIMKGDDDVF